MLPFIVRFDRTGRTGLERPLTAWFASGRQPEICYYGEDCPEYRRR